MNKHFITQAILLTGISLFTTACVSPRQTATAGASVGRVIAVPIGFAASVLNEAGLQSGDIVAANPRYNTNGHSVSKTGDTPPSNEQVKSDILAVAGLIFLVWGAL